MPRWQGRKRPRHRYTRAVTGYLAPHTPTDAARTMRSTSPMAPGHHPVHVARTVWQSTILPLGDRALTVALPGADGVSSRTLVRCLTASVRADAPAGITAIVPAIESLTLHYDPNRVGFDAIRDYLTATLDALVITDEEPVVPVVIPVCYGGEFGPDLGDVATAHRTSDEAIVAAHTAGLYTVAMIGFLPGFPYLEGLPPELHTPRRSTPRTAVPAGSVGIGGSSTGVYPYTSPGGWHIIGRTPRALFSPTRARPALLQAGDRVRFTAITPSALRSLLEQA